jgi:dTDP-4-dehydrorhamnose reductase
VTVLGRPVFDFERIDTLLDPVRQAAPRILVNAAAYTAVDKAESQPDEAMRANATGPALLARYCNDAGIPLIHVSTDYVFDGDKGAPYVETDPTSPTGVYGATKRDGEIAVLAACRRAVILRTSWVYAPFGKNFVLTMLNAARKTDRLRVVADQRGCPTSAEDLAAAILAIAGRLDEGWDDSWRGIFHAAGGGETTWHGLALAVFEAAARHGHARPTVEAIATADWPTPAKRPADSRLDCGKLAATFSLTLPAWQGSVARTVDAVCG